MFSRFPSSDSIVPEIVLDAVQKEKKFKLDKSTQKKKLCHIEMSAI